VWKIGLGFLAFGTSLDIFFHKFSESGSFVRLLHELPCVRDPWMAPCWAIVDFSQYSSSFLDVVVEKKFSDCWFGVGKKGVIKEDTRFVGIHLLVKVFLSREKISDSVGVAGNVGQFVVKVLEVFNPSCLSTSNLLRLAEILQIFVVGTDFNGVCGSKKEGATTFESKEDSGEFLVVGVVVLFGGEETVRVEGDRVGSIVKLL
jgi:hypothetical protein